MKKTDNTFIKQFHCFQWVIQKWREIEAFLRCLDEIKLILSKCLNISLKISFSKTLPQTGKSES